MGGLLLTGGADVQKDRIEVSVWAWGRGLESWLIDHIIIDGSPTEPATWSALSELLAQVWRHQSGAWLSIVRLAIDTGGQYTTEVYAWTRRQSAGQVMAIKGVDGFDRTTPVAGPTNIEARQGAKRSRGGAKLWTVAVAVL